MPRVKLKSKVEISLEFLVPIDYAVEKLGKGFSRSAIIRRIDSGEWQEGVHWVDDRRVGAKRRIIKINMVEVGKLRSQLAGER
jgi:hypothetical protein